MSAVFERAVEEHLRQPVVGEPFLFVLFLYNCQSCFCLFLFCSLSNTDYIDPNCIVCSSWHREEFDLQTIDRASLANVSVKEQYEVVIV